jgi:hypothetical protein
MNWLGVVAKDEGACGDGWRAEWGENDGAGADRVGLRSTVGGKPSRERRVIFFVFFLRGTATSSDHFGEDRYDVKQVGFDLG